MSRIVTITEAAKDALNGGSYSAPYASVEAVRAYKVTYTLEELATLRVSVVPAARNITTADRTRNQYEYEIHVAVMKRLDPSGVEADQLDQLELLVEELLAGLDRQPQAGARFLRSSHAPIYDQTMLEEDNTFMSLFRLFYLEVA